MKKKTIYYFINHEPYERMGMFDTNGVLIHAWKWPDAPWRPGYLSGFMEYLGVNVKPLPKKFHKNALKQIYDQLPIPNYFRE